MGASWIKHFKKEFTLGQCSLKARNPQLFLRSQWGFHPVILCYRIATVIYTLYWLIDSAVRVNSPKWLIYLTIQSYAILTIYFILALVNLICYMVLGRKKSEQNIRAASLEAISSCSPAIPKTEDETPARRLRTESYSTPRALYPSIYIQWFLLNLNCVFAILVTVAFWIFVYKPGRPINPVHINMHGINVLLVLVELFVTAAPIHLIHLIYTSIYYVMYIIFTVIYWAAGGTNLRGKSYIYRSLNYGEHPGQATGYIFLGTCVAIPLLQFLVWNLHLLRRHLYLKCNRKDGEVPHC
ncbi:protein rolling stone-like [Scyliorhinus torazame]|uniref:protein rolling stone-like n=1 Tax=Scyliorhinus torazame TaxID=75743 RepID=UPI003B5CB6E7